MGKRAEARPEISDRMRRLVDEAKLAVGEVSKTSCAASRPQASPARAKHVGSLAECAPKQSPTATPAAASPVPMSAKSTPVKSPDLKRFRSETSDGSSSSTNLPSLPSFSGVDSGSQKIHGLDSQTTLDMAEYFSQLKISGQIAVQLF